MDSNDSYQTNSVGFKRGGLFCDNFSIDNCQCHISYGSGCINSVCNNMNKVKDAHSIDDFSELRAYAIDLEIENKEKDAEIIRLNMLVKDMVEALRQKNRKNN